MPRCPRCKTLAELVRYEGVPIYNCGGCGGHWLSRAKLDAILARRELHMPPAVQERMIAIAAESDSAQPLWCFTCGTAMVRESFRQWREIQLDYCPKCEGLWLDRGELEKCQIYWERHLDQLQAGPPEAPRPRGREPAPRSSAAEAPRGPVVRGDGGPIQAPPPGLIVRILQGIFGGGP